MLGEMGLRTPMQGRWSPAGFPEYVFLDGVRFRKARWRQPYDGVVEQYRQDVPRMSAHLKVYADGRWEIDHVDEDNPDHGRPVEHFFNDHPVGKVVAVVGVVGLVVGGMAAVASALKA